MDDPRTTTSVHIADYLEPKLESLMKHRTQINEKWGFMMLPPHLRAELLTHEDFALIESRVELPAHEGLEDDILAGVR